MVQQRLIQHGKTWVCITANDETGTCATTFVQMEIGTGDLTDRETIASLFSNILSEMREIQPFIEYDNEENVW